LDAEQSPVTLVRCNGKKIEFRRSIDHGVFELLTTEINLADDEGEPADKHN